MQKLERMPFMAGAVLVSSRGSCVPGTQEVKLTTE
jgi:hypothetical protein